MNASFPLLCMNAKVSAAIYERIKKEEEKKKKKEEEKRFIECLISAAMYERISTAMYDRI